MSATLVLLTGRSVTKAALQVTFFLAMSWISRQTHVTGMAAAPPRIRRSVCQLYLYLYFFGFLMPRVTLLSRVCGWQRSRSSYKILWLDLLAVVAPLLPTADLALQCFAIRNSPVKALAALHVGLNLGLMPISASGRLWE